MLRVTRKFLFQNMPRVWGKKHRNITISILHSNLQLRHDPREDFWGISYYQWKGLPLSRIKSWNKINFLLNYFCLFQMIFRISIHSMNPYWLCFSVVSILLRKKSKLNRFHVTVLEGNRCFLKEYGRVSEERREGGDQCFEIHFLFL